MKTAQPTFRTFLQTILEKQPESIATIIAQEALEHEEPELFFQDLLNYGCISGAIPNMIYYNQTHAFFDKHYSEIEEIREDFELSIPHCQDLKNHLAWTAYEIVAYDLYQNWKYGS